MKHIIIGTAGHVDHGKTALIKALTSFDCDTHKEEKQRGITINLGFAHLNLPNGESVGIIDVPGHKDFINTMVGGACGIDFVLLVIAADSGIMPQTIEHINIISALGISKGIVALTKIDLVDDELIEIAKSEISDYLSKTSLKGAPIVGVSAITGQGKDELLSLIEQLISTIEEKERSDLFRMYIDRIFTVKGFGSVVTGSVMGGSIETGKDVFLLPIVNQKLRVRSIERHGQPVERVIAGDRAAINLIGLKNEDFERGMIISDKQLKETLMVDAAVSLFGNLNNSLSLWSNITFLSGTFECQARMHLINKDSLQSNDDAIVQIHLSKPAILFGKDKFIVRNSSGDLTLGGGYIIDASPLHHRKRTPKLVEYLTHLSDSILGEGSLADIVKIELKKEFRPFSTDEVADLLNIQLVDLQNLINQNPEGFKHYRTSDAEILIDENHNKLFKEKVLKILKEHHGKNPIFPSGMETNEILGKLIGLSKLKVGKSFLEMLLKEMKFDKAIDEYRNTWIIYGHQQKIDQQTSSEIQWLENEILKYDTEKPVLGEIEERAAAQRIQKHKIKMYLAYLASTGKIRIFQDDFMHTQIVDKYKQILLKKLSSSENGIDIQNYKDLTGGTKRFRALLLDLFEADKVVSIKKGSEVETRILITQNGRKLVAEKF